MKVQIIGKGVFGNFLRKIFAGKIVESTSAEHIILSIPFHAYKEVAQKYQKKHLINICSVQKPSHDICTQYSKQVTSIHPLFGPNSPLKSYTSLVTHWGSYSKDIISLFGGVSKILKTLPNGEPLTPEKHDKIMAKTHGLTLFFMEKIKPLIENTHDIPDEYLPSSFLKIREFSKQMKDISQGTKNSILANPYLNLNHFIKNKNK